MTTTNENHELSLAVSYYLLFNKQNNQKQITKREKEEEEEEEANRDNDEAWSFWTEDSWTEEDRQWAHDFCKAHEAKCRIPPSIMNNSSGKHKKKKKNVIDQSSSWNEFYQHHQTRFFKDRHYLFKEFPNEFSIQQQPSRPVWIEMGCGVGNNVLPVLDILASRGWIIWALDVASTAIDLMRRDERYQFHHQRGTVFCDTWDMTSHSLPPRIGGCATLVTAFFCLSAIPPGPDMHRAVDNMVKMLHPTEGTLLFRDYGLYDEAHLKLASRRGKWLPHVHPNFYVKSDGTHCLYFDLNYVRNLFADLQVLELRYLCRTYTNRATGRTRRRVWVQGRFCKQKRMIRTGGT